MSTGQRASEQIVEAVTSWPGSPFPGEQAWGRAQDRDRARCPGRDRAAAAQLRAARGSWQRARGRGCVTTVPVGIVTGACAVSVSRSSARARGARVAARRRCPRSGCARTSGRRPRGRRCDRGRRYRPGASAGARGSGGDRIDLLVNNAGVLGPSPQPLLAAYPLAELARVYEVNVFAPLALVQEALPRLTPAAAILDITSDAAVEPYKAGADTDPRKPPSSS